MRLHRLAAGTLLACACVLPQFARAAGCGEVGPYAKAVADAQRQLLRDAKPEANGAEANGDADYTAAVAKGIVAYKQTMTDAVDARLACMTEPVDPTVVSRQLSSDLRAVADRMSVDQLEPMFSLYPVDVRLDAAPKREPMLFVALDMRITYGVDVVLLGYRWTDGHWSRVVRWQSGEYTNIADAFGTMFDYVRLTDGRVVVRHGTPRAASRWSAFSLDVLVPTRGPIPRRAVSQSVFHFRHGEIDEDEAPTLKATDDGFELRTLVGTRDMDGDMQRRGIFRFAASGDTFVRVQPVAGNGRGFVDEWLQVDDTLARQWVQPASADDAMAERARLLAAARQRSLGLSYGAVRACGNGTALYQAELQLDTDEAGKGNRRFAVLRQLRNGFEVVAFRRTPDAQCHGPDLMGSKH